jgi:hypothetical protein
MSQDAIQSANHSESLESEIVVTAKRAAAACRERPRPVIVPVSRAKRRLDSTPLLLGLTLVCLTLSAWNIVRRGEVVPASPALTPELRSEGVRAVAELQAFGVETYRADHGALPPDLGSVGLADSESAPWQYELLDDGSYRITAIDGEVQAILESGPDGQLRTGGRR